MPAITSTSLTKVTPSGTVTMTAINGQSGQEPASWKNVAAVTYEAAETLTLSVKQASTQNMRVTCRLKVPLLNATNEVTSTATVNIEVTMPRKSTAADRSNIRSYVTGVIGTAFWQQALENLAPTT